jgi:hypothetical protein
VKNYCALVPLLAGPTGAGLPTSERNRGGRGALAAGARATVRGGGGNGRDACRRLGGLILGGGERRNLP